MTTNLYHGVSTYQQQGKSKMEVGMYQEVTRGILGSYEYVSSKRVHVP